MPPQPAVPLTVVALPQRLVVPLQPVSQRQVLLPSALLLVRQAPTEPPRMKRELSTVLRAMEQVPPTD